MPNIIDSINKTEETLQTLYSDKIKGAQIRSRVKWIEEGEKNTKYFLGLEKSRQTRKNITAIKDSKGEITEDQGKILETGRNYYVNLYKSTNPDLREIENYIEKTKINYKLSTQEGNEIDGNLTIEECTQSVFKMKLNKTPGIDGLSIEFYRAFWSNLQNFAVNVSPKSLS